MRGSRGYKDLIVYRKAFALAMKVFHLTKKFPKEERYLLIDQFRRSSRSVCSCLAEAYRKRKYQPYFVNKITDADAENSETEVWIDFAYACEYISGDEKEDSAYFLLFLMNGTEEPEVDRTPTAYRGLAYCLLLRMKENLNRSIWTHTS